MTWLEVNRLLGRQVRPHIQLLQTEDGEISDSQDIAEALNSFFIYRTQAVAANTSPRLAQKDSAVPVQFTFKPVEEGTVVELLSNVNMRKAIWAVWDQCQRSKASRNYTGSIPLWCVQPGTTLAPSLCGVFNQSITSACYLGNGNVPM